MDLNIIIDNGLGLRDSDQLIKQKLQTCLTLGYHTVAVAVTIDLDSSSNIQSAPDFKQLVPAKLNVLSRLTVKCSETIQLYKLNKSKEVTTYDLIALEPKNSKLLQYIGSGSTELDILTFNLKERLEYSLFKASYKVIQKRGVCLEINYGPCQLGSSLRRNTICNGQNLTEKTQTNIILSSGVTDCFRLRNPKDAVAIGALLMLSRNKCHEAVHENAKKAINLSKQKRNPAASAICEV